MSYKPMSNKPVIGLVGLGKLGTPIAVSIAVSGFKVLGYDINPENMKKRIWPYKESGPSSFDKDFQPFYDKAIDSEFLTFHPLKEVVEKCDILFIATQTPHGAQYEGITRLPFSRADFDYTFLKEACLQIAQHAKLNQSLVVISTVLPGTMKREILPILPAIYNPAFPAMGTCVKPDEIIPGDYIRIGDIEKGMGVIGKSGLGKVSHLFRRSFSGEMVRIRARGCLPVEVTPEHPVYIASRESYYDKPMSEPRWMEAGELKVNDAHKGKRNDYLVIPRVPPAFDMHEIPLEPFASKDGMNRSAGHGCSRTFPLNEETAWVLGLYVAEGCARIKEIACQCSMTFTLHSKETHYADKVVSVLSKHLGRRMQWSRQKGNCLHVYSGSAILSRAFAEWCGVGAENKVIPEFLLLHSNLDILRAFLEGYMAGDGSCEIRGKGKNQRWRASTVSKKLALQLQLAYARLGIFAYIRKVHDGGTQYIVGNKCRVLPTYSIGYETSTRKTVVRDSYITTRIYDIERIPYEGDVCNIETTDNTYLVSNAVVHNCMKDYLNPEFVLLGGGEGLALERLKDFYWQLLGRLVTHVSVESAELIKVAYNTFISAKIAISNSFMEVAHKIPGCNIDEVTDTLARAHKRLWSPAYTRGGLGDSGPCHPRDNIAMSWLAEKLRLSSNLFDSVMQAREWQTEWLADLFCNHGKDMPKVLLGKSYKPESSITTGSTAILLANILHERGISFEHWDPYVDDGVSLEEPSTAPAKTYFVATRHEVFKTFQFAPGSVVLDPFRYIPQQKGVRLIPIGIGR